MIIDWTGGVSSVVDGLLMLIYVVLAGVVVFLILWLMKYKHKIRIRKIVNGRKIIFDDKAREVKTQKGANYWYTLKTKQKLPLPPSDAIDINTKGRSVVEVYLTEQGEFHYIKDKAKVETLEPLTTEQRQLLINNINEAQELKNKKWQDYIIPVTAIASFTIIVICLLVFWGDMAQPLLEMADKQQVFVETQKEIVETMQDIKLNVQRLDNTATSSASEPPNPNG